MLSNDLDRKVVFQNFDVGVLLHCFHQSALDLGSGIISMMQDAELRMAAFPVEVELAVCFLVEVDAPTDEVSDARRGITHHLLHGSGVADVVARNHRVFNVLLEVIDKQVRHAGDAALRLCRIRLFQSGLAYERNLSFTCVRNLQRIAHSGHTATYYQEFCLLNHGFLSCF